ncbi:NADPH:quinone reductase [Aquincola sp. S2]|uniref:NADPH:quinone reductase n=1 Tax=Pseudaquabacterium terrae TaxID=2732868 RepID=A0ABX2EPH8_9BURK|nr:NADPH:quinone reductase [Aquabacterium terrae]NRF70594.1 NADPH:quinone reductase [Aquabacterium terrae]
MKAVWYERCGEAADVLVHGDMEPPQARPGEVRVRLHASSVNPADTVLRRGAGQVAAPRIIPNSDGAGVIDQVGAGVTRFCVGERVWLYNGQRNGRAFGTAAQYIAIDERLVTPLPDSVGFVQGVTLGIPCMTAWVCLFMDGPIEGRTVVVTGGAGAVGHYAVQLAKWAGARVIATVSSAEKADIARQAGADLVIDYKTEPVADIVMQATAGRGVDRIVEVEFGDNLATSLEILANNATIATYASRNAMPVVPFDRLKGKNVTIHALRLPLMPPALCRKGQSQITQWLESGPRLHLVAASFPLAATAAAHQAVERGGKLGTVVVDCS